MMKHRSNFRCLALKSGALLLVMASTVGIPGAAALAQPQPSQAKKDFVLHCADCHGVDGTGNGPATQVIPGFKPTNLTLLSKTHGGQFPREEVQNVIDGRKRLSGHYDADTDMPLWGLTFQPEGKEFSPGAEAKVKARIAALVDYIEGIQQK